jgi:hypothetical protein
MGRRPSTSVDIGRHRCPASSASLGGEDLIHERNHEEEHPMSRESDWHVFDKACDITAMAARGSAATATPAQVADIFRAVHAALQEVVTAMINSESRAGF